MLRRIANKSARNVSRIRTFSTATTSTPDLIINEQDIKFNLHEVLKIEETLFVKGGRFEAHSKDFVNEALSAAISLANDKFAPHYRKNDLHEPELDATSGKVKMNPEVKEALTSFYENGFGSAHADNAYGGMQLPSTVTNSLMFPFYAANIGTITFPFLSIAAGNMLRKYGTEQQIKKYLLPMYDGRFTGTMNLSETQAGSSLGDITTKAFKRADGTYEIVGNKMWISGGEHQLSENIVHMVLAKVSDPNHPEKTPAGVKGISLFIVPKNKVDESGNVIGSNDVSCGGLNHKMGWRGATNCVMNYGENKKCIGELLGEEGKGLNVMFMMMNEARISVGLIATALGYAGYAHSLKYARERKQGRKIENKDPKATPTEIINHADVKRMLLIQKSYVEGSLLLCLYASQLVDFTHHPAPSAAKTDLEDQALLLDVLTPLVKSWPSEWCLEANKWAIQIHGGYGYTRDFLVEQHYRDNRLNMIHEGTNGIQSLDLLGRKMTMKEGRGLALLLKDMRQTVRLASSQAGDEELQKRASELEAACARIEACTKKLLSAGKEQGVNAMMTNSHEYLNMVGFSVIAWMLLKQEVVAAKHAGPFYEGKRITAKFFFEHELPKTKTMFDLLTSLNMVTHLAKDEHF